jgi:RNA-directed DNA polymerase
VDKAKPFDIPKREIWEAFKKVKKNQGAAGVDGQSIADFEADLANNLYKLWNRMSSGAYFPPPVRRVNWVAARRRPGRWVFQRSPIESPRKLLSGILSPSWNPFSIGTPMGTDQVDQQSMASGPPGSAVGGTTGC